MIFLCNDKVLEAVEIPKPPIIVVAAIRECLPIMSEQGVDRAHLGIQTSHREHNATFRKKAFFSVSIGA